MSQPTEMEIRKSVRDRYAKLATEGSGGCECNPSPDVPQEAATVNAGCGSPLKIVKPMEGDVVLDLGSGGGIDVFRASKLVGEMGKTIGVDSTPEMVWRARETARKNNYRNVEFRLGELDYLPIGSTSVDYVVSNCVINLAPDKQRVLNEAFRVLKPGGELAIADITVEKDIPGSILNDLELWSACVSGAISTSKYRNFLATAGFTDIRVEPVHAGCGCCPDKEYPFGVSSTHIRARKPLEEGKKIY